MSFYACFACALPFRRRPALLALGLALTALGAAGAADLVPGRLSYVATPQLLEFVAGLAVGEAWLAGWRVPARVGALTLAAEPARRSPVRRALERLGDASHAVYLAHFPLFWAADLLASALPRSGPHAAQLYVVGLVVLGLSGGVAVYLLVEVPVARGLRRLARSAVRRAPAPAAAAA